MGDRGQVKIIMDGKELYIYSHWGGTEMLEKVQDALAKRWRWGDGEYLTRIIYDEIVGEAGFGTETGYGIGFNMHGDIEHPLTVVDMDKQTVHQESFSEYDEHEMQMDNPISFDSFCKQELSTF